MSTTLKRIKKKGDFNEESGVSVCLRYLENRRDQLWYDKAIESDLPIGSGELESSHRHVIQKRLKISGAWWTTKNANKMLALRTLRANGDWKLYWNELEVEGLEAPKKKIYPPLSITPSKQLILLSWAKNVTLVNLDAKKLWIPLIKQFYLDREPLYHSRGNIVHYLSTKSK